MLEFIIALMECTVTMSVLVLLFVVLTPKLSKKYAAKWLYYGWLVIVIGLIIPFRIHLDMPLIQGDFNIISMQQMELGSDMLEQSQTQNDTQCVIKGNPQTVSDDKGMESGFINLIQHRPWYMWVGALWIFGAGVLIVLHGIRHRRFLQIVKRWSQEVTNQQTLNILQESKIGLGISKHVALRVCSCITTPMMIGMLNPVILLPLGAYSESELSLFFRHELVHLKRKDLWYKILVFLATAIHWFNPFIYLMAKAIAVQCEISCDMEVVKNIGMDKRKLYSETILSAAKNKTRIQTAFSTNFYGGKKEMKNRIISIMDGTEKKTGIFILCTVLILTLGSGAVFAACSDSTEDLELLTEKTGAITIYYYPYKTLEENVLETLEEDETKTSLSPASGIDVNGRRTPPNRTEPYCSVGWDWIAKDNDELNNYAQKTLTIDGTEVTIAFTDETESYIDNEVIKKMVNNIISFASVYKDKTFDYDYKAFIDMLADKGIIVIQKVTTPEDFGWCYTSTTGSTGFWAQKVLTKYDAKEKITSVYDGTIIVPTVDLPEDTNGDVGVQVGDSFMIRAGETLAIDIKDAAYNMPKVNWAIVDVDTGEVVKWMANTSSGYRFVWIPSDYYVGHTFRVMISTSARHNISDNAVLEVFTYQTGDQEMISRVD